MICSFIWQIPPFGFDGMRRVYDLVLIEVNDELQQM